MSKDGRKPGLLIIPVFISNRGCPQRCVFCRDNSDEDSLTGKNPGDAIGEIVRAYLGAAGPRKKSCVQIAFYGGNFTGLDRAKQYELLTIAAKYVDAGLVQSLRISTRPDALGREEVEFLRGFPVRTVEIGVQSMSEEVLTRSRRGHTADDVRRAVAVLKENGFAVGLHLMAGLPGESRESFLESVDRVIELRPDTVRIHPTLVFRDTELAELYRHGAYRPLSLDEAVATCTEALTRFEKAGIPVVRLGLQPSTVVETSLVAGPYHPAFRSLVEGEVFLSLASRLLTSAAPSGGEAVFLVSPRDGSFFRGLNNRNIARLQALASPAKVVLKEEPGQRKGSLKLQAGGVLYSADRVSNYTTGNSI